MITVEKMEIAHLDFRYDHTRIHQPSAILKISASIERFGQLVPVAVVANDIGGHILIDGYLRAKAMKHMGKDCVLAHCWEHSEADALIHMMAGMQGRPWDLYEQAAIINELRLTHGMSIGNISALLGKDKSWVSRRLSLFEVLDDQMIALIRRSRISSWSAQRVLVPMARANPEHAHALAENLKKDPISSRRLWLLFDHYKKSNRTTRQNIVNEPQLFLKALDNKTAEGQSKRLHQGVEGKWLKDIRIAKHILARLTRTVPEVFYAGQSRLDRRRLLTAFKDAAAVMQTLSRAVERSNDARSGNSSDNHIATSVRVQDTTHQSNPQSIPQYSPQCH